MGFRGRPNLSLEKMEQLLKEGKCFKCGERGHLSYVCPEKTHRDENQEDIKLDDTLTSSYVDEFCFLLQSVCKRMIQ